ncbi:amidohydrolase family protein [Rhizobium leguminosarum]|uniref:amidohydrolase family protein n=1 Tax=Rhizobium leguminosarum TaxID=384 RepID=UPI001C955B5A|nr:amidohydrolase family protein [Rhizobium leguminosarum]MBY5775207.1 amidohydrolase family protein [Rhizobium leguminosarum]
MQYIDAFNHFFPKPLWDKIQTFAGAGKNIGKRMQNIPCIYDLDERFRVMDGVENYRQVISLGMPPVEAMGPPNAPPELARLGNEGFAELCTKYPERFPGYLASLPMNNPVEAVKELERVFEANDGAVGLQIHSNVNGMPLDHEQFFPIFETAAKFDRPVFLHPSRGEEMPDYLSEDKSRYEIWWTFGWPYETSAAMARIVLSGLMDKLPNLKLLAHHLGAMVPYFEGRVGPGQDQLGKRTSTEDLSHVLRDLKRRPFDYFKDFYADTAVFGSRAATVCGLEFYGVDKVLFASDSPFDPERGPGYIRDTIAVLNSLSLAKEDMEKICFRNAQKLFRVE